jgi:hypothetical protein
MLAVLASLRSIHRREDAIVGKKWWGFIDFLPRVAARGIVRALPWANIRNPLRGCQSAGTRLRSLCYLL